MVLSFFLLSWRGSGSPACTRVSAGGDAFSATASAGPAPGITTAPAMAPTANRRGTLRMGASLLGVGRDLHLQHAVRIGDGAASPFALLELIDRLHAGHDLADHGVLAVEPRRVRKADEELAVRRIRVAGARHADGAALERRRAELGRHIGVLGSAGAVAALPIP